MTPEVGRRYAFHVEDCCLHTEFEAQVVRVDLGEHWWTIVWSNGVTTGTYPHPDGR